jgi:hypothetical protein
MAVNLNLLMTVTFDCYIFGMIRVIVTELIDKKWH